MPDHASAAAPHPLREVALFFLRLGSTAFGGPAAHIALMRAEVVTRRRWLDDQEFLDLLGAANLIPGPNSTELAIHLGYRRAGWPGLLVAGLGFITPAMLIVLVFAWAYQTYGQTPPAAALLYGVQPVILAIVGQALWDLSRQAVKDRLTGMVGAAAVGLYALGVTELHLLFGGAGIVWLARRWRTLRWPALALGPLAWAPLAAPAAEPFSLSALFWIFTKIGAVLYGSGYVLLAFLRADFVDRLGWLTDQQLLDAIALGQMTPVPVFTNATVIGYPLGGLAGGLLATLGIFLPAFVFVALSRATRRTLIANLSFAMFMIAVMLAAIFSVSLAMPLAVIGHEGGTVLVSLNGLRLLGFRRQPAA